MNELSLFTGAGGGVLGSKLLGHRIIGYVEYESYCQEILKQRIADGILDPAPIFGDIRKFISEGWAERYRGKVDILSGGFPCQSFSVAGKRLGEKDPRNMWPETIECIRLVRPRYFFGENVPGLLSSGYFDRILSDLASCGYDVRWTCLGADDVGANHRRKRLWILAYATSSNAGSREGIIQGEKSADWKPPQFLSNAGSGGGKTDAGDYNEDVAESKGERCGEERRDSKRSEKWNPICGKILAYANDQGRPGTSQQSIGFEPGSEDVADPNKTRRREQCGAEPIQKKHRPAKCGGYDVADPGSHAAGSTHRRTGGRSDGQGQDKREGDQVRLDTADGGAEMAYPKSI